MKLYSIILLLLWGCHCYAASIEDTVRVYFRDNQPVVDFNYHDNQKKLEAFVTRIATLSADTTLGLFSVYVKGNTSPSGTHAYNLKLGKKRALGVVELLRRHFHLPDSLLVIETQGVDWDELTKFVEADTCIPKREEVLRILRYTPIQTFNRKGQLISSRKKELMDLKGGQIYRMLQKRFFDKMRNATVEIRFKNQSVSPCRSNPIMEMPSIHQPTVNRHSLPTCLNDSLIFVAPPQATRVHTPLHRLAIKSNLLYNAILMPSLEIEYRLNEHWSINLEGDMAWWKRPSKHQYYQLATVSPEGRLWLTPRRPWHGHYLGAFGGFSWYDLENGGEGYRGEAITTGISYGYMFPIARNLSLEASAGVGYMFTEYKLYLPIDGCYVYQETKRMNYFGPLKLKFSFVWRLWDANKKKGGRR